MPIRVIDRLEVVKIAHDDADRMSPARSEKQLASEGLLEEVTVVEAGQRVMIRLFTQLLLQDLHRSLGPGSFGDIQYHADDELPVADPHHAAVTLDIHYRAILSQPVKYVVEPVGLATHALAHILRDEASIAFDSGLDRSHSQNFLRSVAEDFVELRIGVAELAVLDEDDADKGLTHQPTKLGLRLPQRPVDLLVLTQSRFQLRRASTHALLQHDR